MYETLVLNTLAHCFSAHSVSNAVAPCPYYEVQCCVTLPWITHCFTYKASIYFCLQKYYRLNLLELLHTQWHSRQPLHQTVIAVLITGLSSLLWFTLQQVQPAELLLKPHLHACSTHALPLRWAGCVAALERHWVIMLAPWAGLNSLRLSSRPGTIIARYKTADKTAEQLQVGF
jgi:hypothetical protein